MGVKLTELMQPVLGPQAWPFIKGKIGECLDI